MLNSFNKLVIILSAKKKIWLSSPHIGETERQYVKEAFDSNWIAPAGPHIIEFEDKLSKISKDYHIAALNSGTAAIHLALLLLGVKREDEVLCSSFTFSASANPITYLGAHPIYIDRELDTSNMSADLIE